MTKKITSICIFPGIQRTLILGLGLVLMSCGTEVGNPVVKRPTTPRTVAQDTMESDFLELSETLSEDTSSVSSLALDSNISALPLKDAMTCSGDEFRATTTLDKSKERSKEFPQKGHAVSILLERQLKIEWNSPSGGLSCVGNSLKKTVRLLKGATETRTGSVIRSLNRTTKNSKLSAQDYSSATFASKGDWKTTFDDLEVTGSSFIISRSSAWTLTKTNSARTSEGETSAESTSSTVESSPLKIKITRARGSGAITNKTIESGKVKTSRADGSIVEVSFESLVFTESDSCYPSKGKVRGTVTPAPSSGQSPDTFEIDFSNSTSETPELVFSDAQRIPLSGSCVGND